MKNLELEKLQRLVDTEIIMVNKELLVCTKANCYDDYLAIKNYGNLLVTELNDLIKSIDSIPIDNLSACTIRELDGDYYKDTIVGLSRAKRDWSRRYSILLIYAHNIAVLTRNAIILNSDL